MLYEAQRALAAECRHDLGRLGEAALALLREDERAVAEHVELALRALERGRVVSVSA
jgi:hypothetical protein